MRCWGKTGQRENHHPKSYLGNDVSILSMDLGNGTDVTDHAQDLVDLSERERKSLSQPNSQPKSKPAQNSSCSSLDPGHGRGRTQGKIFCVDRPIQSLPLHNASSASSSNNPTREVVEDPESSTVGQNLESMALALYSSVLKTFRPAGLGHMGSDVIVT